MSQSIRHLVERKCSFLVSKQFRFAYRKMPAFVLGVGSGSFVKSSPRLHCAFALKGALTSKSLQCRNQGFAVVKVLEMLSQLD